MYSQCLHGYSEKINPPPPLYNSMGIHLSLHVRPRVNTAAELKSTLTWAMKTHIFISSLNTI